MTDVEGRTSSGNNSSNSSGNVPNNPYSAGGGGPLPNYVHKLQRILYLAVSVYALTYFNFFRVLLKSPYIRHTWFQVALALTVAILGIKAYVELYEGKVRHRSVNYANFRHTTHAIIVLIGAATVAYNCALWPHYGWNAPIILGIFFFGIILQVLLLVPTSVQNFVALVAFTFFLQEYSGYSNLVY